MIGKGHYGASANADVAAGKGGGREGGEEEGRGEPEEDDLKGLGSTEEEEGD